MRIKPIMLGFHRIDPCHVGDALVVAAFHRYEYALRANLALNDNVDFAKALGQTVTHHFRFVDLCSLREIEAHKVDQALEVV
jgi:hypothetical protein